MARKRVSAHLINQIEDTSIQDCLSKLQDAHERIKSCVIRAQVGSQLETVLSDGNWASRMKRITISLDSDPQRRSVIGKSNEDFIEIINQCANVERLIHALGWAAGKDSELKDYGVRICHPTTSSSKGDCDLASVS